MLPRRFIHRHPSRRPSANPLRLAALEGRLVPATFFVTNTTDNAASSLRACIAAAKSNPGPDVIQFQSVTGTITLTSGELAITDTAGLDIQGPGADKLTVKSNGTSRVFNTAGASAGVAVSIAGLTISNGSAAGGGGVLVGDEAVSLTNCVITGNSSSLDGGGICVSSLGSLNLQGCTVSNNLATGTSDGGGIAVTLAGSLVMNNSTVSGNVAADSGGGVYFRNGGAFSITNSTLSGNAGGSSSASIGGAIYFFGSAIGTLTLQQCTVSSNTIGGAGGGVVLAGFSGKLAVQNSTIVYNASTAAGTTGGGIARTGGTGDVTLDGSIVAANASGSGNGPDLSFTSLKLITGSGNVIGVSGPGAGGNAALSVVDNQTGSAGSPLDPLLYALANNSGTTMTHRPKFNSPAIDSGANPAGLAFDQRGVTRVLGPAADAGAIETANLLVTNVNDSGPGSLRQAIQDANLDVGIFNVIKFDPSYFSVPRTLTMTGGEYAITDGGGITGPGNLTIDAGGARRHFNVDGPGTITVYLTDMTLVNGKVVVGNGGSIRLADDNLTLDGVTLANNKVVSGNGGAIAQDATSGDLTLNDCDLHDNFTQSGTSRGGAVSMESYGELEIDGTSIAHNTSAGDGGGIAMPAGGKLSLVSSAVTDNIALSNLIGQHGGGGLFAVFQLNSGFSIDDSTFSGNKAANTSGGGLMLVDFAGAANVRNSTIYANTASVWGGGIASVSGSGTDTIQLESTVVAGNQAGTGKDLFAAGVNATKSAIGINAGFTALSIDATTTALFGADLKLGPLQVNGAGTLPSHLPAVDSPLVNNGSNPGGLANDQRGAGYGRSRSGGVDIGAVEAPTNFVVTTNNTLGPGSLIQAVVDANGFYGADTISFDATFFSSPKTIVLSTGELYIQGEVSIIGPGAALATLSGNNTNRIFNTLLATGSINISGLTFTDGLASTDGGTLFYGQSGGAIMTGSETVTLQNCVFTGNSSPNGSGGAVAVTYAGTLTAVDCTFSNNHARDGGAIASPSGLLTTLTRCSITGNVAEQSGGVQVYRSLVVDRCTVSGNQAIGVGGKYGNGGGIEITSNIVGSATITNSTISGNQAWHDGGGVFVTGNVPLTISHSTIVANTATTGAGGNVMRSSATGLLNVEASIIAAGKSVTDPDIHNSATTNVNYSAVGDPAGFTLAGANNVPFGTDLKIGALAANGGPTLTHMPLPTSPLIDGGPMIALFGTDQRGVSRTLGLRTDIGAVEYLATLLVTNTADAGLGSLRQAVSDANISPGHDSIYFDPAVFATPQTIRLTTGELLMSDGAQISAAGLPVVTVDAQGNGRALRIDVPGIGKSVSLTGLAFIGGNSADYGGGVSASVETLNLTGVTVAGNTAAKAGGGLFISGSTSLNLDGCTLANNRTDSHGGGLSFESSGHLAVVGSTIAGNTAMFSGGGIDVYFGGSASVDNSTISGNHAGATGGGFYFYGAVGPLGLKFRNSTVSGNTAISDGGGIVAQSLAGTLTVQSSTVTGNATTAGKGGGIANVTAGGIVSLESTLISGNSTNIAGPDVSAPGTVNANTTLLGSLAGIGTFNADAVTNNLLGKSPLLGPLAANGGRTQTHALLPGSPAINNGSNPAFAFADQREGGFVRVSGGAPDIGAFEVQPTTKITSVVLNNGDPQRSRVTRIDVTFDQPPTLAAGAFQLSRTSDAAAVTLNVQLNGTVATLTFVGGAVENTSLADGRYRLLALASAINGGNFDGDGNGTAGDNYILNGDPATPPKLYRLFGDVNGDGFTDNIDLIAFRAANGSDSTSANWNPAFDSNGDGFIDNVDFLAFRQRIGLSL